jgi:dTDP-glucose 4,6-dehydratase
MIRNAIAGEPLPVYGKGDNVRDWLHVEDHVEAIDTILRCGRNEQTYVIGGHAEKRNLDVVQTIADVVDEQLGREPGTARALIRFVKDRPGHDFRYAMDPSKLEAELGWKPAHDFESGIRQTVRWYLDNRAWLDAVVDQSYRDYYETQYSGR